MKAISSFWNDLSDPGFNEIPPILASGYLPSLDGLRALAIALVIMSHSVFALHHGTWYDYGHTAVQLFFVISGFLITALLLKERVNNGQISLKNFYIRRVLRIFPVAYLFLIVLAILNLIFMLHITPGSFAVSFLYLRNFTLLKVMDWQTTHFWSLGVEEQFYLLFPVILAYNFKLYVRLIITLIVLIPVINVLYYHGTGFLSAGWVHAVLLRMLLDGLGSGTSSILWGSLCAILLFKGRIPASFLEKYKWAGIYLLFFLLLMNTRDVADFPGKEVLNLYLFAPGVCLVILFGLVPGHSMGFALLNNPVARKMGVLSYSLYVWQQLFTHFQPWANLFPYAGSLWINLPLLGIVSYLSYHFFEKRFLRLKDRYASKSRPVRQNSAPAQNPLPGHHSIAL